MTSSGLRFTDLQACEAHAASVDKKNTDLQTELNQVKDGIATHQKNNASVPKKTKIQFLISEIISFVAQFSIAFLAIALSSNFFEKGDVIASFATSKIGGASIQELIWLMIAIFVVVGIFVIAEKFTDNSQYSDYLKDFLFEIPRAIYAFGATSGAACVILEIYLNIHPTDRNGIESKQLYSFAIGFLIVSFMYGFILTYNFKKKEYILKY